MLRLIKTHTHTHKTEYAREEEKKIQYIKGNQNKLYMFVCNNKAANDEKKRSLEDMCDEYNEEIFFSIFSCLYINIVINRLVFCFVSVLLLSLDNNNNNKKNNQNIYELYSLYIIL